MAHPVQVTNTPSQQTALAQNTFVKEAAFRNFVVMSIARVGLGGTQLIACVDAVADVVDSPVGFVFIWALDCASAMPHVAFSLRCRSV
eukprot:5614602-Amphidinium_carterae.2